MFVISLLDILCYLCSNFLPSGHTNPTRLILNARALVLYLDFRSIQYTSPHFATTVHNADIYSKFKLKKAVSHNVCEATDLNEKHL